MKKSYSLLPTHYSLTIGWLYPELMSTYGDQGNMRVFQKRCDWRGIATKTITIDQYTTDSDLKSVDMLFGGGAQDREQEMIMSDLRKKGKTIQKLIENDLPALFVCGAPQLFGKYYEPSVGTRIEGLGIFDMISIHPGPKKDRLIGNVIAKIVNENIQKTKYLLSNAHIVGFENHGGRTFLGRSALPFAKVVKGYGNNGEDGTEGIVYKNAIGTYFHGPFLPKNPEIADWLISKALEVKYKEKIELEVLDDSLADKARGVIYKKLKINS